MAYEFMIRRPTPFPNRAAVLAAYRAAGFKLFNVTPVPNAHWDTAISAGTKWLPRRIRRGSSWTVSANLETPIGRRTTVDTTHEFRVAPVTFRIAITSSATTDANRKRDLQSELASRPRFQPSQTTYPLYEELGYASITEFIDGYDWNFTALKGGQLQCQGSRIMYTVAIPILDPADPLNGNLIANFYPNRGSSHQAILNKLVESDTKFFETV